MLRLGLLVESDKVPTWGAEIIKVLSAHHEINFVVAVYCTSQHSKSNSSFYTIFKKFDSYLGPAKVNYSEKEIPQFHKEIPVLTTEMTSDTRQISFSSEILTKVSSYAPDVLIYFGSKTLGGNISEIPKYGVWSLCFGESNMLDHTLFGFWEWYYKKPRTKISLIRFTEQSTNTEVIRELSVQSDHVSVSKNQASILSKAIALMTEEVAKRVNTESSANEFPALEKKFLSIVNEPQKPNWWQITKAFPKLIFRASKRLFKDTVFEDGWVIFYDLNSTQTPSLDFQKFKALIPPGNRFWADPFVISQDDKHYIFFEEFLWTTNKGHISCLVLDASGKTISSKVIVEKPYHLSYPFIFQHNSTFYMIPESTENKTIDLYECVEFPFNWKFKRTLISDIHAVDSTIHFHENRYWLFCGVQQRVNSPVYDDLNIFYTDDVLEGSWTPHAKNPVVSDIKTARPAGKIFNHEGALCRPSQIGEPYYGYGLALNRITELNEINYKEENYINIKPDWRKGLGSVHTLNFSNKMTVTDGVLKRFRMFN